MTSLLAVCALVSSAAATSGPGRDQDGHDQRCFADPGQHARGDPAVQQSGQGVPEGQPVDPRQARRVPVDRPDLRGQARRRHVADGLRGAVHGRPDTRRQRSARRPDRARPRTCRTSRSTTRPSRRGHDGEGQDRRAPQGCVRAGASLQPQALQHAGLDPNKPPTTWAQLAGLCQADRAEDRQDRLRRDGQGRQHGRLDPDDARVRARRADGSRQGNERQGDAQQPADRHRR